MNAKGITEYRRAGSSETTQSIAPSGFHSLRNTSETFIFFHLSLTTFPAGSPIISAACFVVITRLAAISGRKHLKMEYLAALFSWFSFRGAQMDDFLGDLLNSTDSDYEQTDATGLTKRERLIVQKTWNEVCKIGKPNVGIALFDLYFRKYPEYVKLFKAFQGIPADQLAKHPRLKAHGTTVVQAISGVVDNLDDAETAVFMLQKTGRDHVKRNIKPENFYNLKSTILELLESALGSQVFTPVVRTSWDKALTVVMDVTSKSMKEEELRQSI